LNGPGTSGRSPLWFWPLIVVGTLALWLFEWLLSSTPSYTWLGIAFYVGFGVLCAVLWMRSSHSFLAALSWAAPLSALWVVAFLFVRPAIVATALNLVGLAFLFAMISSDRVVDWWYRVVLRSHPPQPPAP
jgi:hypothetical protein